MEEIDARMDSTMPSLAELPAERRTKAQGGHDQSAIFDVSQFLVTRALTVLATELGLQWEHVAKSYEFIESLERFLMDQHKNALPHDVEKLPKDGPEV
jgi:hypothetical protein